MMLPGFAVARVTQLPRVMQPDVQADGAAAGESDGTTRIRAYAYTGSCGGGTKQAPGSGTSAPTDTFVWGPYDFETGWTGWTAVDLTVNPSTLGNARLLDFSGSRGNGTVFSGKVAWTGTLGTNACGPKACFPGYDNNTNQVMFKSYASVSPGDFLSYAYRTDAEPGYDFTHVIVTTAGAPTLQGDGSWMLPTFSAGDTLTSYTSYADGLESLDLSAYAGNAVTVYFLSQSDGGYSDGDCNYNSLDGLFEIDNLAVGAESPATFESGNGGWTFGRVSGVGSFATLEVSTSLPNSDPCPTFCGITGKCITIYDSGDPNFHRAGQNELVQSPSILLTQNPAHPVGSYVMQFDVYANLPLANGNFYFWHVRYSPVEISDCSCQDAADWSSWLDENTIYYGGGVPVCTTAAQFDVSAKIPGHATKLQMAVGVINYPIYVSVPGGNQSPYFDNISLRAAKVSAPAVVMGPWDYLQSAYPDASSFATAKSTAASADAGLNTYSPNRIHTRLGDSTVCSVALSCNSDQKVEVDYIFKVSPGPCMNTAHPWWVAYQAQPKIPSGSLAGFAVARADTARTSTGANSASAGFATFMSCFNELAPAAGTSYAAHGNWSAYTGGVQGVSIFPDDLFTPGTQIWWLVHSTYIPVKTNGDYYLPDLVHGNGDDDRLGDQTGNQRWFSAGGTYDPCAVHAELYQVLPLTTQDGNTSGCASAQAAHCFLYVDKTDQRGPQYSIENAFRNLSIAWDRYDVRASTSSMGNDLGSRYTPANYPLGHAPGPLPSLVNEVYSAILWQTGALNSTNFSRGSTASGADAGNAIGLLQDWLVTTSTGKYLWVSGDGNSRFLNATGNRLTFLNTVLGTTYSGPQYRDKNTAWGVNLTGLGPDCTSGLNYALRGNWCPQRRSYAYVTKYTGGGLYGVAVENFKYPDASGTWYASVQQTASSGSYNFRTQNDCWSLEQLRQSGVTYGGVNNNANVTNWSAKALGSCFTGCFTNLDLVAAQMPAFAGSEVALRVVNPLPVQGATVPLEFTVAEPGPVTLRIYDAAGRLRETLVDGPRAAGAHQAVWDARHVHPGVYFAELTQGRARVARQMVIVR